MFSVFTLTQEVYVNTLDGWKVVNQFPATKKVHLIVQTAKICWRTVYEIDSTEILQVWLVAGVPVCLVKEIVEREIATYLFMTRFTQFI